MLNSCFSKGLITVCVSCLRFAHRLGDSAVQSIWDLLCQVSIYMYNQELNGVETVCHFSLFLFIMCSHNNKTAMYQHPYHSRPPPPYHRVPHSQDDDQWSAKERKPPPRSHSYRSVTLLHCVGCACCLERIQCYEESTNINVLRVVIFYRACSQLS